MRRQRRSFGLSENREAIGIKTWIPMGSLSQDCDRIKKFESCRLTAYQDAAGVWTIGYGHTGSVYAGMQISQEQAGDLLKADLKRFEAAVNRYVTGALTQGRFDALVSFTFNVGEGALKKSTLLKKMNAGDMDGAAREFDRNSVQNR